MSEIGRSASGTALTLEQAKAICDKTVDFFQGEFETGGGSANLVYEQSATELEERITEVTVTEIVKDKILKQPILFDSEDARNKSNKVRDTVTDLIDAFLSFKEYRNKGARSALDWLDDNRELSKGKTAIKYGAAIVKSSNRFGNCTEHACVAAYYASQDGVKPAEIFLLAVPNPVDHAFCYIGPRPTFNSVDAMTGGGWIIDAWAGVFAPANTYKAVMEATTKKWLSTGMRLGQMNEKAHTWSDPTAWFRDFAKAKISVLDSKELFL